MNLTRRNALKSGAGALALGTLAGCLDDTAASQGEFDSAYAAFFPLWDWSQAVAGDEATIENPVDFGQLGHGWEPDGDLPREVASTSAFVYLDTPEFSWAQDLAKTLKTDYESVVAIDGLAGLESQMLESDHEHEEEDEQHEEESHEEDDEQHNETEDEQHNETEDEQHNETEDEQHNETEDEQHNETEDEHGHEDDEHEGEKGSRDGLDPHVWVDPVLAQEMVDTIAAGFAEIDADNAETYEANAAAYNERLADLDSQFEQLVADADGSTAVLASHSSFAYVEDRYGFELHTVSGISPDSRPSQSEISATLDFVDEIGTDVILYDRFESDRLAETIVNGSNATEAVPITAAAGTTEEWNDNGWGYVDQMEQVTIPAFRRALGAE